MTELSRAQTISRYGWRAVFREEDAAAAKRRRQAEKERYWEERETPSFVRKLLRRGALRHLDTHGDENEHAAHTPANTSGDE